MPPRGTIWPAVPHTKAKIDILRGYLNAYFPILGTTFRDRTFLYVDGFAGPGEYSDGSDGSPIVALESAIAARDKVADNWVAGDMHFAFIEQNRARFEHLRQRVAPYQTVPGLHIHLYHKEFVDGIQQAARDVPQPFKANDPLFVFIDPFGSKGVPFDVVRRLLSTPTSEILLNLDGDGITRQFSAVTNKGRPQHLTSFFDSEKWDSLYYTQDYRVRVDYVRELYVERLRDIGTKYVFDFEMQSSNGLTNYYLVFASHHHLGLEKMKGSMLGVAQDGSYTFRDPAIQKRKKQMPLIEKPRQLGMFDAEEESEEKSETENYLDPLPYAFWIMDAWGGQQTTYEEMRDVSLNSTPFLNPKGILAEIENRGNLEVDCVPGYKRRRGDFPADKIKTLRFLPFVPTQTEEETRGL